MSFKNQTLFDKGDVCSIFEETLSDGSHVYNLRVYDSRDETNYAEVETCSVKHAVKLFEALNGCENERS